MKMKNGSIQLGPSDKTIQEFEEYCRITLPDDFKEFFALVLKRSLLNLQIS